MSGSQFKEIKGMKEFTFAIDVDEVIRHNIDNMLKVYNEEYGDNKTMDDVFAFKVDEVFPKIQATTGETASKYFFEKHAKEVFTDSNIIEGSKEAIETLKKYGKIYIVTYQKNVENRERTLEWLEKYDITYDGICFVRDKSVIYADYLIDDNDWNFLGCNCKHGILITKPYNTDVKATELLDKSNCKTIQKFTSLKKFSEWFEENYPIFEKYE